MKILETNNYHLKPLEPVKITCGKCGSRLLIDEDDWLTDLAGQKPYVFIKCPNCDNNCEKRPPTQRG